MEGLKADDIDVKIEGSVGGFVLDPEEDRRVRRKIDRRLLPIMFVSYGLQFLDKTTLGFAAVMGIIPDLVGYICVFLFLTC